MAQSSHSGRFGSWLAVVIIWIGFVTGGIALMLGNTWWLFWLGVGLAALGGVIALSVGIFDDVILDVPRAERTELGASAPIRGGEPGRD